MLLGTMKLWLVRYMSSLPSPSLHELTLKSIEILLGGAFLLSGVGSFFVVLANLDLAGQISFAKEILEERLICITGG